MVALQHRHPVAPQHRRRHLVLHALRHGLQAERRRHLDDRIDQLRALRVVNPANERDVDLERRRRHLVQLGKGGVAPAEVVDRDAESRLDQLPQPSRGVIGRVDRDALGDLQLDARDGYRGPLEVFQQFPGEVGREELAAGDVDRELQVEAHFAPTSQAGERLVPDLAPEFPDEAEVLRHGNEGVRRDPPVDVVLPARQGFAGDDAPALRIDHGLEPDLQLPGLDRRGEPVLDVERLAVPVLAARRPRRTGRCCGPAPWRRTWRGRPGRGGTRWSPHRPGTSRRPC